MNAKKIVILFCLLASCSGCARLETKVSILKPEYLKQFRSGSASKLAFALSQTAETWQETGKETKKKIDKFYANYACETLKRCTQRHNGPCPPNSPEAVSIKSTNAIIDNINSACDRQLAVIIEYNKKVRERFNRLSTTDRLDTLAGRKAIDSDLTVLVTAYASLTDEFKHAIEREIGKIADAIISEKGLAQVKADAYKAIALVEGQAYLRYGRGASGIGDDPLAFIVAGAGKENWIEKYNHVWVEGQFGNTDIVIILDSGGNYSIKGVAFDATDTANFVSKTLSQMVIMGAQIAGVPIPAPGSTVKADTPGRQLAAQSGGLASKLETHQANQAKLRSFRRTVKLLAQAIVAERDQIKGGDDQAAKEQRAAAVKAIGVTFQHHLNRLVITKEQGG